MINRLGFQQTVGRANATFGGHAMGGGGGGRFGVIPIIDKTDFAFDGRTGSTQTIVLADGIDATGWKSAVAEIRLHASAGWTATASLAISIKNSSIVPEDPTVVFLGAAVGSPRSFLSTDAAPLLVTAAFGLPIASQLQVSLIWTQGGTPAGAAQTASISVNLVARPR